MLRAQKKKKAPKKPGNSSLGNWGVLLQAAFPFGKRVQVPEEENLQVGGQQQVTQPRASGPGSPHPLSPRIGVTISRVTV